MGSNIALTLSDWATKLYNNFKFPGFSEMLWDNSTSWHTIKQNVSRFLQVPELIDAFWSSINSFPFFLLYGETNSLFLFLCFIGVTWATQACMMLAQFIHLQRFVHPIPLATHGHLDFRLPSRHDSCIRSSSLDLFPCPHRQPLLKAVSSIPFSLPLVLLIWLTFLQLWHRQSRVQGLSFFLQGQMSETQEILVPRRFFPQLHLLALIVCFTESPEAENSEENKCTLTLQ